MTTPLLPDMIELLESGVSIGIATRDADLRPECAHGLGLRVAEAKDRVTVYVNDDTSARLVAGLQSSGRAAVVVSRLLDHHTIQLKGRVLAIRPGTADDHAIQDRYVIAYAEQVAMIGLPRQIVRSVRLRPCLAIEIAIDELFVQTPGPQAGRRMGGTP
jgi:hypothetical protein